jgi:MoaA/NifB/PqqE/SkfB family radical SAM enzyme
MTKGKFSPLSVYFSLTNRCKNRCIYCSNYRTKPGKDLPKEKIIEYIRQVQDAGAVTIGFTGGEPLMRDDLEEIIASVNDRSYTILFTSGYSLTPERVQSLKKSGLTIASVSIDSHYEDEQTSRRGSKKAYGEALRAINLFSEAGIYTTASAVMSPSMKSWNEIEGFADFLHKNGADELRILREIPAGKACGSGGEFDHKKIEALRASYNRDPEKITIMSLPGFEMPGYCGCGAGIFHLYIDAKGNVCPCDFVQTPFGSLEEQNFSEIYSKMNKTFRSNAGECLRARLARGETMERNDSDFHGFLKSLVK